MQTLERHDHNKPTYLVAIGNIWKFLASMTGNDAAVMASLLRPDYAAQLLNAAQGHRVVSELIHTSVKRAHSRSHSAL